MVEYFALPRRRRSREAAYSNVAIGIFVEAVFVVSRVTVAVSAFHLNVHELLARQRSGLFPIN